MAAGISVIRKKTDENDGNRLTIVITAHNEGTLLAKTVESCRRALKVAVGHFSSSEIMIVADRAKQKTRELAELLAERRLVDVCHFTDFGDPGHARNFGVEAAKGDFITFVDGDDLINHNYIKVMMLRAHESDDGTFLRPQMVITFGQEKAFLLQFDSRLITNKEVMLYSNPWAMPVFGRRKDFLAVPFVGDDKVNGFSHEDWEWNLHILNAGGTFEAIDDAIYFARRRRNSRTAEAREFQYVIRPVDFYRNHSNFAPSTIGGVNLNESFRNKFVGKIDAEAYFAGDHFYMRDLREKRAHSALDHFMRIGKREGVKIRKIEPADHIGKFAANASMESMIMLSDLDGSLDPFAYWRGDVTHYDIFIENRDTSVWRDVLNTGIFDQRFDVVFVLPWVRRGGADLVALKHVQACKEMGLKACIITTLDHEIEWLGRMPKDVPVLPFGTITKDVGPIIQLEVFHRLLVELRPRAIHNVNSDLFWKVLERNGLSIRSNTKVVCSLYCQDFNFAGSSVGYDRYIDVCDPYVDKYVTDNTVYADYMTDKLGVEPDKITVVKYPIETGKVNATKRTFTRHNKILWSSRLDYQKGFDLLWQIASKAADVEFHFYGEMMLDHFEMEDTTLPANQVYRGKFAHVEEIDPEEFDCFLYTGRWDGLPNIVLEMGMKRLPILSFVTGGLSDVVTEETAWPIREVSVPAVLAALRRFYEDPDHGIARAKAMSEMLADQHHPGRFLEQCKSLYSAAEESATVEMTYSAEP
jgi:glycosyltransferase involved in cell wall biosynthesis